MFHVQIIQDNTCFLNAPNLRFFSLNNVSGERDLTAMKICFAFYTELGFEVGTQREWDWSGAVKIK
jgi:hypothetical protein